MKIPRGISSAVAALAGATLLVKFAGLGRELLVAHRFGRADELDAFLVAFAVPSFAINVIAASFAVAIVPAFIETTKRQGAAQAQELFAAVSALAALLLLACAAMLYFGAPLVLPHVVTGFGAQKMELTLHLLRILLPTLVLSGLAGIWGAILNTQGKFALAGLAPAVIPLCTAAWLLSSADARPAEALAYSVVAGTALQAIILAVGLKRQGYACLPRWTGMTPQLGRVVQQYCAAAGGALLVCSSTLIDQGMASMLASGSVAALEYANKLVAFPQTLAATAIGSVALPYFSHLAADKDHRALSQAQSLYLKVIFAGCLPVVLVGCYFSNDLVRWIFQRGAFGAGDTAQVGAVLRWLMLQLPFYVSCFLMLRIVAALQITRLLIYGNVLSAVVNVAGNYILMRWLGVAGIALATSIVFIVQFCYLRWAIHRHLHANVHSWPHVPVRRSA